MSATLVQFAESPEVVDDYDVTTHSGEESKSLAHKAINFSGDKICRT